MQIRNNILLLQCQKRQHNIGLWCNGNTTDSGPVIPSSNLGSPTKSRDIKSWLFCLYSFAYPPSEFRFAHLLIKPITASIRITIFKTIHLPFLLFSSEYCILTTIFCVVLCTIRFRCLKSDTHCVPFHIAICPNLRLPIG